MKWSQFLGGILIGLGFGLMVGATIVQVPEERSGERKISSYPVFPSMILVLTGVIAAGIGHRRSWPLPHDRADSATSGEGKHDSGECTDRKPPR